MTTHTSGPWRHYNDTDAAGKTGRHEIQAIGKTIALIYSTCGDEVADLSNAQLISAAPDLLEAVKALVQSANPTLPKDWRRDRPVSLARAAIAKAEGHQ